MELGWNIFAYIAPVAVLLSAVGAVVALRHKERSWVATLLSSLAIVVMALFVGMLWHTLERPPLRTMGETRLWYSLFMLVAGTVTYHRWHYRWILSFSTLMATVFIMINILRPEIHDESLMPALQSVWFIPHVSVYMFSYSLLGCATLLAMCGIVNAKLELREVIERLLYGGIGLFTVGMLTGALWAKMRGEHIGVGTLRRHGQQQHGDYSCLPYTCPHALHDDQTLRTTQLLLPPSSHCRCAGMA